MFGAHLKRDPAVTLCTIAGSRPRRLNPVKNWLAFVYVYKGGDKSYKYILMRRKLASDAFPILGSGCSLFECIPRASAMALE